MANHDANGEISLQQDRILEDAGPIEPAQGHPEDDRAREIQELKQALRAALSLLQQQSCEDCYQSLADKPNMGSCLDRDHLHTATKIAELEKLLE